MQSGYFKSGSASIYYELHGEGEEILVLLHGNGGNCKNFKNQIPFFYKKYKNSWKFICLLIVAKKYKNYK